MFLVNIVSHNNSFRNSENNEAIASKFSDNY